MKNTIYALLLIFAFTSCKKTDEGLHSVSGVLYIKNKPVTDASVSLNDMIQYSTKTNSQGYFKIDNISTGQYQLKAGKISADSSFVIKSYDIDVNTNINLDSIILPNPVAIENCKLDSSTNKVTIIWLKSSAKDFREYKVYSHLTSGLDETTGTLEHVATDANDTTVILQIPSGTKLYYRVFVLNEFGRLGGSNIKSVTGVNINFLAGGDFENSSLFQSFWRIDGQANIIDTLAKIGSHCLLLNSKFDTINYNWDTNWIISQPFLVEKNVQYEFSFWYKVRGWVYTMYPLNFFYSQDNQNFIWTNFTGKELNYIQGGFGPFRKSRGVDWTYYSVKFIPNNNTAITFYFESAIEELYIDNLLIKKNM